MIGRNNSECFGRDEQFLGSLCLISVVCSVHRPGPSEAAYLKLSPSEAEFGSKSSELSRVEFAFRVGQKLPPSPPLSDF